MKVTLLLRKVVDFTEILRGTLRSSITQATNSRKFLMTQWQPRDAASIWKSISVISACANFLERNSFFYQDASTIFVSSVLSRWSHSPLRTGKSETYVVQRLHAKSSLTILISRISDWMKSMLRNMKSSHCTMLLPKWTT